MEYKPVPLQPGEEAEYMLALKQELRGAMRSLPYFVKPAAPKKGISSIQYNDRPGAEIFKGMLAKVYKPIFLPLISASTSLESLFNLCDN